MDNAVTLCGNLTRDPELKYTPSGQAVCALGLAVNRRWQDRQTSEWKEEVSFFNLTAWGELGENVAESLHKGDRVVVFGDLQQRSWENAEGEKRSTVEVKVNDLGPSLRWATSATTKTAKGAAGERAPHPAEAQATAEPAMAGAGSDEF